MANPSRTLENPRTQVGPGRIVAVVGKVVALITRLGPAGPELCVFEHPTAGIQLPAGTLEEGEEPLSGAMREAFEETGLEGLEVTGALLSMPSHGEPFDAVVARPVRIGSALVPRGYYAQVLERGSTQCLVRVGDVEGVVAASDLSFDGLRHLVHLTCAAAAPDEWWVVTPDGGGLIWRCHWMPLGRTGYLGDWHETWLGLVRPTLAAAPQPRARVRTARDPVESDMSIEMFFAPPWGGRRALFSLLEAPRAIPDHEVGRSEAITMTAGGQVVAVGEGEPLVWGWPGGRREPGESLEETLRREVAEEACARVIDHRLLGYQRFAYLVGDEVDYVRTDAMFWARVGLEPFEARFETTARRLMTASEALVEPMWRHPITKRLFAMVDQIETNVS